MKILVVSDSHGDVSALRSVLRRQPGAALVIHLGDGARDLEQLRPEFPEKAYLQLRGNNDIGSSAPDTAEIQREGVRIFCTHGHLHRVKYETDTLLSAGRGADVILYGHTHRPENGYQRGCHLINPGSLRGYGGSYALLELTDRGILANIVATGEAPGAAPGTATGLGRGW